MRTDWRSGPQLGVLYRSKEEGCPEDLDGDEVVGFQDLILLLGVFDSVDPSRDLDGDGTVGMGDTLRILSRWGSCRD